MAELPPFDAPQQLLPTHFGLDPLFSTPVRVIGAHIAAMPGQGDVAGVFLLYGRAVQAVEVCGHISAIDRREERVSLSLDDGSGVPVEVVVWRRLLSGDPRLVVAGLELGMVARAVGRLREFSRDGNAHRSVTADRVHAWGGSLGHWAPRAATVDAALRGWPSDGEARWRVAAAPTDGTDEAGGTGWAARSGLVRAWAERAASGSDGVPFRAKGVARSVMALAAKERAPGPQELAAGVRGQAPAGSRAAAGVAAARVPVVLRPLPGYPAFPGHDRAGDAALQRHWDDVIDLHSSWYAQPVADAVPEAPMTAAAEAFWARWRGGGGADGQAGGAAAVPGGAQSPVPDVEAEATSIRGDRGDAADRAYTVACDRATAAVVRWLSVATRPDADEAPLSVGRRSAVAVVAPPWGAAEVDAGPGMASAASDDEGDEDRDAGALEAALAAGQTVSSSGVVGDPAPEAPAPVPAPASPADAFLYVGRLASLPWFRAACGEGSGDARWPMRLAATAVSRLEAAGLLLRAGTALAAEALLGASGGGQVADGPPAAARRLGGPVRDAWLGCLEEASAAVDGVLLGDDDVSRWHGTARSVYVVASSALLRDVSLSQLEVGRPRSAWQVRAAAAAAVSDAFLRVPARRWADALTSLEAAAAVIARDKAGTRFSLAPR